MVEVAKRGEGGDALTSSTTADEELLSNLRFPKWLRRRRAIYGVGLLPNERALPASHRPLYLTRRHS